MPTLLGRSQISGHDSVVGIWVPLGSPSQTQAASLGPQALWSEKTQVPVRPLGAAAAPHSEAFPVVVQCSWDFLAGLVLVPEEKQLSLLGP